MQEKALKLTDKLAFAKDLNLFEGMSLVNTGSARSARSYEQLSDDPKTRETQIEERIVNNVGDFLENHVIQLRLSDGSEESRDLDEEGIIIYYLIYHHHAGSLKASLERAERLKMLPVYHYP